VLVTRKPEREHDASRVVGLTRALADPDALVRLMVLRRLEAALLDAQRKALDDAREQGHTWARIADSAGWTTRQAAQAKSARLARRRARGGELAQLADV
jgi:hypothetical protein